MTEIMIDSVRKSFGQREVLRGAHLRLRRGTVTGMLGRNGTGKSTLLKILTGQLAADHAYIGVDGVYTPHLYQTQGLINYLPQHACHPGDLRLGRLLRLYGISHEQFFAEHPGLFPAPETRFMDLSGGTKRLFEVLLLLAADTDFTLLDEPFTHVMPIHVSYLKEYIRRARARKGVLVTDHMYEHVLEIAEDLYVLHSGTSTLASGREDLVEWGYLRG